MRFITFGALPDLVQTIVVCAVTNIYTFATMAFRTTAWIPTAPFLIRQFATAIPKNNRQHQKYCRCIVSNNNIPNPVHRYWFILSAGRMQCLRLLQGSAMPYHWRLCCHNLVQQEISVGHQILYFSKYGQKNMRSILFCFRTLAYLMKL